jgi:hypothetical protein
MARQLIDIGTKQEVNPEKLSVDFINDLGRNLNTPEMVHIEKIYFTKNGSFYYNAHEYRGNDKKYKGRKFARFQYTNVKVKDAAGVERWVRQSIPMESFEILKEYDAEYFVDSYIKSIKNNK